MNWHPITSARSTKRIVCIHEIKGAVLVQGLKGDERGNAKPNDIQVNAFRDIEVLC
jgi:hypothetical protein